MPCRISTGPALPGKRQPGIGQGQHGDRIGRTRGGRGGERGGIGHERLSVTGGTQGIWPFRRRLQCHVCVDLFRRAGCGSRRGRAGDRGGAGRQPDRGLWIADPQTGLVPQLQSWLAGGGRRCGGQNAGVSGDTTAGGQARLDWALGGGADALIVTLGGNDMLRGLPPSASAGQSGGDPDRAPRRAACRSCWWA